MKTAKKPLSMSAPPIRVRFTGSADKERTVRWLRELIEKARAAKAGVQSAA